MATFDMGSLIQQLRHPVCRSLLRDLSLDELRNMATHDSVPNNQGSPAYVTRVQSRNAPFTEIVYEVEESHLTLLEQVWKYLRWQQMIRISTRIGSSSGCPLKTNYYVTRRYARMAHMFAANFFTQADDDGADIVTVVVPEWHQRKVLVFPSHRVTLILGIDYYGESKMATLRMAMHIAREDLRGLGLHAGSKIVTLRGDSGELQEKGMLVFGLSGTGKTTITTADHGLVAPEGVEVLQDDINILMPDGQAFGTENNFYIKTDNVSKQLPLLGAAQDPRAILENVWVDDDGNVNFDNHAITTNGRAIVPRGSIPNTSARIDLPRVDVICFNMRRYDIPPVGRLVSAEQAAAYFMLGESTVTSAEDPARVGQAKRVVGFDPFVVDHHYKNGNRLLQILRDNPHISCYVLSTGRVGGQDGANITPEVTFGCIEGILRGSLTWRYDDVLGYEVPANLPVSNAEALDPATYWSRDDYARLIGALRAERRDYLATFSGLAPAIVHAV
ncbi:MAG TPA: phosphoenolpyruvate carboxykinase [Synergistaceae bacterium]|nr:phosphoenolpyruvate carboxykinase [Synergistaceae bacterium]HQF91692.1 phosphoenolpyruvate carboxykinase [Synergistaceae bacterium]HQH78918.1 phosphoenolpyruvate carboxykinase [Synergistaceae bacterium]HQK24980.1 phosphoenolpyruvate carboxykinase [Synergistaceae bacterium]